MLLLLLLVVLPVVLFVIDNRQMLADNGKDEVPAREPAKATTPIYSVFNETHQGY